MRRLPYLLGYGCLVGCAGAPPESGAQPPVVAAGMASGGVPTAGTGGSAGEAAGSSGGVPTTAGTSGIGGGSGAGGEPGGASGGVGMAGAGGSAGAPLQVACAAPAALCEDFEAGNLEQFAVLETGGVFDVDATHVYSGGSAVMLTIPANQRGGFLEAAGAPLFPLTGNTVWGRLMVYFEDLPSGHFDTVRGAPEGGGTPWYNIGGQGKALLFNYYSGALDCWSTVANKPPLPLKKWVCWEFQIDGSKNDMALWVDRQPSHSINDTGQGCVGGKQGTWAAPTFGSVRLGQVNAQTTGNQTRLWMDDIALGTSGRIGCPEPSATAH